MEDAFAIEREAGGVIAVSPEFLARVQVAAGNQNWFTTILGESPEYLDMRRWQFVSGAPFTEQDVRSASKVAVIGHTAAAQLFGTADPVGQIVRVKHVPFLIIGLLRKKGTSLDGNDQDDVIIAPYTTVMKRVTGDTRPRLILAQVATSERCRSRRRKSRGCCASGTASGQGATTISRCSAKRRSRKRPRRRARS